MSVKKTPPENDTLGKVSLQSTKSGAGEQFLLLDCRAEARIKGSVCSQTPVFHNSNNNNNNSSKNNSNSNSNSNSNNHNNNTNNNIHNIHNSSNDNNDKMYKYSANLSSEDPTGGLAAGRAPRPAPGG